MSPKNKGHQGKESAVPPSDEFIDGVGRVSEALRPHVKKLILLAVLLFAALIVWSVWNWLAARRARAATHQYLAAIAMTSAPIVGEDEPEPAPPAPGMKAPLFYRSETERAEAALPVLSKVADEYSSLGVADLLRFDIGRMNFELGKFEEAAASFRAAASADLPPILVATARENVGYSLEAEALAAPDPATREAGLERALEAFKAMQPAVDGPRRDYSLYHQGRILVALGRTDDAVALFKEILVEYPDSGLVGDIELRLDALGAN